MSNRQANDQSRNRTKSGLRVHANVEVRYCKVGRGGSLIIFYPFGKSPLRGYIPTGLVHYVDWSATWIGARPTEKIKLKVEENTSIRIENSSKEQVAVRLRVKGDTGLSMNYREK